MMAIKKKKKKQQLPFIKQMDKNSSQLLTVIKKLQSALAD